MRHHTTDPVIRAGHVADCVAEQRGGEYRASIFGTVDWYYDDFFEVWLDTYYQTLQELQGEIV